MFVQLIDAETLEKVKRWDELKRWERREIGQDLRRMGLCYREIASVIPVGKGTLSGWCHDLELTPAQSELLEARQHSLSALGRIGKKRRHVARDKNATIRRDACAEAHTLAADPHWVAGTMAYWAEGSKRTSSVGFSNSDPALVRLFLIWASRYLDLTPDRFLIQLHLHAGQDEDERQRYWSAQTGIPLEQFRKTYIKPEGTGHRKNRLYNGTAQVRVRRSGALLHRILGWTDGLADSLVHSRYTSVGALAHLVEQPALNR